MARGRPRRDANPAARFERIVQERPGGSRQRISTTELTSVRQPVKPRRDMTAEEKFLHRRARFVELLPSRLAKLDEKFQLLVNLSNREHYEYSTEEVKFLVARLQAWTDLVKESFKARYPRRAVDLPVVKLSEKLRPMEPTARTGVAPAGLEDVW